MLAPALCEGDAVALIAPAGPLKTDDEFERAQDMVRALGLSPQAGTYAKASALGYLAGTDEDRAADVNQAVHDPNVRGIFALRGGYGTMRILPRIEYEALARSPKVILGYSDVTALLNSITERTGLVTFHGPVAALSQFTPLETQALRAAVMQSEPLGTLSAPEAQTLVDGTAHGPIVGGNLSLIAALVGTPYEIDTTGALLVLEDVDESPYRIDRMLTQLRMSGALSRRRHYRGRLEKLRGHRRVAARSAWRSRRSRSHRNADRTHRRTMDVTDWPARDAGCRRSYADD